MPVTSTSTETVKSALDEANLNKLPSALQRVKLGTMLTPIEEVITKTAPAAAFDLSTESSVDLGAFMVQSVRVTTAGGTGTTGNKAVVDSADAPADGVWTPFTGTVSLSADGTTLTFAGTVTAIRVRFIPLPSVDLTADFAS